MLKRLLNPRYARFDHACSKRGFWTDPHWMFNWGPSYRRSGPSAMSTLATTIAFIATPFAGHYSIKFVHGVHAVYKLKHNGEADGKLLIEGYIKNGEFITKQGNYKLDISDMVGGMNVVVTDQSAPIYVYGVSSEDQLRAIAIGSYKEVCNSAKKDIIPSSMQRSFLVSSGIFVWFTFFAIIT